MKIVQLRGRCPGVPLSGRTGGFSLVELLVVMAIIGLLAAFVVPAVGKMLGSTELNRGGQMVGDTLGLARQEAVKANREVYVLFYKLPGINGQTAWRGLQVAVLDRTKTPVAVTPIGNLVVLPTAVEFSTATYSKGSATTSYSPLLVQPTASGTRDLNGYTNVAWQGVRFRADGSLDRAINPANAFLTLVSSNDSGPSPKNYYTVQVNSVTGMVRIFRP